MQDLYTDIIIYLIDYDSYPPPKLVFRESNDYYKELYLKFISLLSYSEGTDDYSYQIERLIMVASELEFINKKRYQQYRVISKLTEDYNLNDERRFFSVLFGIDRNHSLSDTSMEFLYDHFGELMEKALVDISVSDFQILNDEDIQSLLIYSLRKSQDVQEH